MTPYSPSPRPSPIKGEGVIPTFYEFIKVEKNKMSLGYYNPRILNDSVQSVRDHYSQENPEA